MQYMKAAGIAQRLTPDTNIGCDVVVVKTHFQRCIERGLTDSEGIQSFKYPGASKKKFNLQI